jgi:hypothetical protein
MNDQAHIPHPRGIQDHAAAITPTITAALEDRIRDVLRDPALHALIAALVREAALSTAQDLVREVFDTERDCVP